MRKILAEKLDKTFTVATSRGKVEVEFYRGSGFKYTTKGPPPKKAFCRIVKDETGCFQRIDSPFYTGYEFVTIEGMGRKKLMVVLRNYKNMDLWREVLEAIFPKEELRFF